MIGERHGMLVVMQLVAGGRVECRCDCGTTKVLRAGDVRRGTTKSCGCFRRARIATMSRRHGCAGRERHWSIWIVWRSMRQRCQNPKHKSFADYGGRGITVCAEWESFEQFNADMGPKPAGMQLERRENDKGYSKENCIWATRSAQARNRRPRSRLANGTYAPRIAA